MTQRGWEVVDRVIEGISNNKMGERIWKVVNRIVEIISNSEVGECRR